jgi:hypothetical protein
MASVEGKSLLIEVRFEKIVQWSPLDVHLLGTAAAGERGRAGGLGRRGDGCRT